MTLKPHIKVYSQPPPPAAKNCAWPEPAVFGTVEFASLKSFTRIEGHSDYLTADNWTVSREEVLKYRPELADVFPEE